jgi:hypothetical protein
MQLSFSEVNFMAMQMPFWKMYFLGYNASQFVCELTFLQNGGSRIDKMTLHPR